VLIKKGGIYKRRGKIIEIDEISIYIYEWDVKVGEMNKDL
jgi:hypothetical protein